MGFDLFSIANFSALFNDLLDLMRTDDGKFDKAPAMDLIAKLDGNLLILKNERSDIFEAIQPAVLECERLFSEIQQESNRLSDSDFRAKIGLMEGPVNRLIGQIVYSLSEEEWSAGKSKDKSLNFFINVIERFHDNPEKQNEILAVANDYRDYFSELSRNVRRLIKQVSRFPAFESELLELYELQGEAKPAFESLMKQMEGGHFDKLESYFDTLRRYSDLYFETQERMARFRSIASENETVRVKRCPRCKTENPASAWTCGGCGFIFPDAKPSDAMSIMEGDETVGPVMTIRLRQLLNAIEDFQDEEIGQKEFEALLTSMEKDAAEGLKCYEDDKKTLAAADDEMKARLSEIDEDFHEGLIQLQEGLKGIREWLKNHGRQQLIEAIEAYQEGTTRIYQSQLKAENLDQL